MTVPRDSASWNAAHSSLYFWLRVGAPIVASLHYSRGMQLRNWESIVQNLDMSIVRWHWGKWLERRGAKTALKQKALLRRANEKKKHFAFYCLGLHQVNKSLLLSHTSREKIPTDRYQKICAEQLTFPTAPQDLYLLSALHSFMCQCSL